MDEWCCALKPTRDINLNNRRTDLMWLNKMRRTTNLVLPALSNFGSTAAARPRTGRLGQILWTVYPLCSPLLCSAFSALRSSPTIRFSNRLCSGPPLLSSRLFSFSLVSLRHSFHLMSSSLLSCFPFFSSFFSSSSFLSTLTWNPCSILYLRNPHRFNIQYPNQYWLNLTAPLLWMCT